MIISNQAFSSVFQQFVRVILNESFYPKSVTRLRAQLASTHIILD